MGNSTIVGNVFLKVAILVLVGVVAALVVMFTVTPGPGSISLAAAAWGLAIWLGILTLAFVALLWQFAAIQRMMQNDS